MSGFMRTVLKKSSGFFFYLLNLLLLSIFLFAFHMAAACKSYIARNVENLLLHVPFIYLSFFIFIATTAPPPPLFNWYQFRPGYTRLNSVRAATPRRSRLIGVL